MRSRLRKACARIAVAITASVVAFGGGTLVAGPAGAAGSSSTPVIDVTNGRFNVILSNSQVGRLAAGDSVTAFHGFSTFQKLTIQSQGFDLEGRIQGKLRSHDFKSLWQVYNLPSSAGYKVWGLSFKKDTSQSVLKEVFRREQLIDVNIDITFRVKAAALRGVSTLRIGFETLRLELDGKTKDFTVVNPDSGGAKDQDGDDVPIDFEPI
ncbi:hypothetical protein BZB76_5535 [Actinomadura pelletieri DSM 43383]|uniref:Uncharacterized protein n=1 Tax=Actinomadura pelletieri DSM 43383 TaxID=1120940 RepID=A0A495QGK6_9ACTN|nr:hypothetical protein [Actinomadura pelletieri]RKS71052.1 hypothetical protein BZB76_5535 [Actinomadura pelletieri DSM 43383]